MSNAFKYQFACSTCAAPVRTNLEYLDKLKLCHNCGRKRKLVEAVLDDKGLMAILDHVLENMGDQGKPNLQQGLKEVFNKMGVGKETVKPGTKVDYKCPKCGDTGFFSVVQAPEGTDYEKSKKVLSSLPMCPQCMMKAGMSEKAIAYAMTGGMEPTPGMPRTEGPVGPTPIIKDPDEETTTDEESHAE